MSDNHGGKNQQKDILAVGDSDVYILNPLYRLRNEQHGVDYYGWEASANHPFGLDHSWGITLSLFDGARTIEDISRIVIPFLKDPQADDALAQAKNHVRKLVSQFTKTSEEQKGEPPVPTDLPSQAALIPAALLPEFGRVPRVVYDPRQFLPERAFPGKPRDKKSYRKRAPYSLFWHLTSQCATDCRYCYLGRRNIPPQDQVSLERILELIKEAHEIGVFEISLSGGDVLLYPHLGDILEELSQYSFLPLRIATKAYLSEELAKRLAQCDVVWEVQFSCDSTVPQIADWLVGKPGFFAKAMESIDNALAAGLRVSSKAVITPYNILTIPRYYRELRSKGVQTIRLAAYSRSGFHHSDDLFNHPESIEWLMEELELLKEEYPDDFINLQNGPPVLERPSREELQKRWPKRSRCTAGRSQFMICADGQVIACEQMPEVEEAFCGNVKVQSLQEIWDSKKLDEKMIHLPREKFKGTSCYDCEEREECHVTWGYCYRDTFGLYGSIYLPATNCPKNDLPFVRQT